MMWVLRLMFWLNGIPFVLFFLSSWFWLEAYKEKTKVRQRGYNERYVDRQNGKGWNA